VLAVLDSLVSPQPEQVISKKQDANSIEKIRFFIKVPFTKKRSVKSEPLSIIFIR
jgi:hypothetical protein